MGIVSNHSSSLNSSVCIVAILRDEERFLDEWISYHKLIGTDHFFLYDDDPSLPLKSFLKPHAAYSTIIPWAQHEDKPGHSGNQLSAYTHALNNYIRDFEWVAFIDADEFIVLKEHENIHSFLSEFTEQSSISLNWQLYGHNGYFEDPNKLVTHALFRRMSQPSAEVKSITKTNAIDSFVSPHYCNLKYGIRVDANKRPFTDYLYKGKTDAAVINHYICRSFKSWMNRIARGDVNFNEHNKPAEHVWRLDKELCLKEFVTKVSVSYNECIDKYMQKYSHNIHEQILSLNRANHQLPCITEDLKLKIIAVLELIAEILVYRSSGIDSIGLMGGKPVVSVFLCEFARHTGHSSYQEFALKLLNEIGEEISQESPVSYADGLAGFGSAIEYLIQRGFLKTDADDVLNDIDYFLHYKLIYGSFSEINLSDGVTGIGMYFVNRLKNPFSSIDNKKDEAGNIIQDLKSVLDQVTGLLEAPFNTYYDCLSVIDFVCEAYPFISGKSEARNYLNYAADKFETMAYEDTFFRIGSNFDYLCFSFLLVKTARVFKDESYLVRAAKFALKYEGHNTAPANPAALNAEKGNRWLLYLLLMKEPGLDIFGEIGLRELRVKLGDTEKAIKQTDISHPECPGTLLNTLAGTGLNLLTVLTGIPPSFISPFQFR